MEHDARPEPQPEPEADAMAGRAAVSGHRHHDGAGISPSVIALS